MLGSYDLNVCNGIGPYGFQQLTTVEGKYSVIL